MLKGSLSKFSFAPRGTDIEACKHLFSTCQITSNLFYKKMDNIMNNVIIADFDETITNRDTIGLIGELPYILNPELKPPWSHFVNVYNGHYRNFQSTIEKRRLPLLPLGSSTVITDANFMQLFGAEFEFQKSKRLLELSSITEAESFDIFKGIKHQQVRSFVENRLQHPTSILKSGFVDFISSISKERFFIVSVNWSLEFIEHVVGGQNVDTQNIKCNNLISRGDEYTGKFSKFPLTGYDKMKIIQRLSSQYENNVNVYHLWYIGDSDTDLLSILYPNINGVLLIDPVGESRKFHKLTIEILGLNRKDMDEFAQDSSRGWYLCCSKQGGKGVYIVRSWKYLQKLMSGDNFRRI